MAKIGSLSLTELAAKIEGNKALKRDWIVETPSLAMEIDEDEKPALVVPGANGARIGILETAHDQIGARLGIPAKYYDRMRAEDPELLAINVNTWFQADPQKRMIRSLGGDARAFLSNRYNRIENEEIAEVALPVLAGIPDVKIVASEVTDRRMYIQAVAPRIQGEVKKGDIVQAGVMISNSEIGMGTVTVAAIFWRLWCNNGAVSLEKHRSYHVGRQIADSEELWRDDTRAADDRVVLLKVRDMVAAAVDETVFTKRLVKMQGLTLDTVTGDPAKAVELLGQKVGASEDERGGILRALIEGGDLSAWGMLNAVTAQAHTAKSFDRAIEFETAGGALLDLPKGDWTRILEAA